MEVFKSLMSNASSTPRMDGGSFGKLSSDARKAWSGLSAEDRAILLGSKAEEKKRLVNLTEMGSPAGGDDDVDLTGFQEHTVCQLRLIHAAFVCESHLGPVICHLPQQAHMPDCKSVLSTIQMEANGCTIQDKPKKVSGEQPYVESPDGYRFPLKV